MLNVGLYYSSLSREITTMADEFTVTLKGQLVKGYHTQKWGTAATRSFTQTGAGVAGGVATIGYAAEEVLGIGDITTQGFLYLKNLDITNFVTYGPTISGVMVEFGKLKAGEEAWLRVMPSGSIRAQANPVTTGNVLLQMLLFED